MYPAGLACVAFEFFRWDIKQFCYKVKGFWVEVLQKAGLRRRQTTIAPGYRVSVREGDFLNKH